MRKTSKRRVGVADIDDAVDRLVASLGTDFVPAPRGWVDSYEIARRLGISPSKVYLRLWRAGVPTRKHLVNGKWRTLFDASQALARITKKREKA